MKQTISPIDFIDRVIKFKELTPTEFSAWVLVVTYAGFTQESDLLESIYKRGLAGRRIDKRFATTLVCSPLPQDCLS
jgi:hypothetical protein